MGGNGSKQTKGKKNHKSPPEHQLSERNYPHSRNKLKNPVDNRPIELSWLQQNNPHDNYNRIDNHHHIHHDERLRRIPLAINRWPIQNDQPTEQKSKSFIEEYVRQ